MIQPLSEYSRDWVGVLRDFRVLTLMTVRWGSGGGLGGSTEVAWKNDRHSGFQATLALSVFTAIVLKRVCSHCSVQSVRDTVMSAEDRSFSSGS